MIAEQTINLVSNSVIRLEKTVGIHPKKPAFLDFYFEKGGSVSGQILNANGLAEPTYIEANPLESQTTSGRTVSEKDGAYLLTGLAYGKYELKPNGGPRKEITVLGQMKLNIELNNLSLTGVVNSQSTEEEGLSNVSVILWKPGVIVTERITDRTGQFSFAKLEPGEYKVTFYKEGFRLAEKWVDLSQDAKPLTPKLNLAESPGVALKVFDQDTDLVLKTAYIKAISEGTDDRIYITLRLDEQGNGILPSSLAGKNIEIFGRNFDTKYISNWDGRKLFVTLTRTR